MKYRTKTTHFHRINLVNQVKIVHISILERLVVSVCSTLTTLTQCGEHGWARHYWFHVKMLFFCISLLPEPVHVVRDPLIVLVFGINLSLCRVLARLFSGCMVPTTMGNLRHACVKENHAKKPVVIATGGLEW